MTSRDDLKPSQLPKSLQQRALSRRLVRALRPRTDAQRIDSFLVGISAEHLTPPTMKATNHESKRHETCPWVLRGYQPNFRPVELCPPVLKIFLLNAAATNEMQISSSAHRQASWADSGTVFRPQGVSRARCCGRSTCLPSLAYTVLANVDLDMGSSVFLSCHWKKWFANNVPGNKGTFSNEDPCTCLHIQGLYARCTLWAKSHS